MKEDNFEMSRNFLATDKVPESIFGIPIVQDASQYTEADRAFFKEHPDAGGYYDMSDEQEPSPEQGALKAKPSKAPDGESPEFDRAVSALRSAKAADAQKAFETVVASLKSVSPYAHGELTKIEGGRYARGDERILLMTLLRGDGQYDEGSYGRYFYGDRWDGVKAKALKARGGQSLYGTGVSFSPVYGKDAEKVLTKGASDPTKSVFTSGATAPAGAVSDKYGSYVAGDNYGRAAHWASTGYSYVPPKGVMSFVHEVFGHGWNPAANGRGNPADPAKVGKWKGMYYVANDAEFAAEFGNLRKQMFRESYSKYPAEARAKRTPYDIAEPGNFEALARSYAKNPKKYAHLTDNSKQFIEGYNRLMSYSGTDPDVTRRKGQVSRIVASPDMANQFVSTGKEKTAWHA